MQTDKRLTAKPKGEKPMKKTDDIPEELRILIEAEKEFYRAVVEYAKTNKELLKEICESRCRQLKGIK